MWLFEFDEEDPGEAERILSECEVMEARRSQAIAAAIKNNPCHHFRPFGDFVVGRHITVVEIIDQMGDTHLIPIPSENLTQWEAIGMLMAASR